MDPDHVVATRAAYQSTADTYAEWVGTEVSDATEAPLDQALLAAFAESLQRAAPGPVADVGCGPGRVAAFLADSGLDVVGFDVTPAMLVIARQAHPGIMFEEGTLTDLPVPDASLAGAVCWYSIIHTPPEHLDAVCRELARILRPDGHLLLAFQAGEGEAVHRSEVYGTKVSLTSYRHAPEVVMGCLSDAGLRSHASARRDPELPHESSPQAFVLARPVDQHRPGG